MKFLIKIFTTVIFLSLNLIAMEQPEMHDLPFQFRLEAQIFGRRIIIVNQSGIRLLVKVFSSAGQMWQSVLENNFNLDIGSLNDIPKSFTFEPYGTIAGRVYLTQYGTVLLEEINKFGEIPENFVVAVKIKQSGMLELGNGIEPALECCKKNLIIPNLFPSVALYMTPGYIQGAYCRSVEEFKEKDCFNFARYVLGLGRNYSAYDVKIKAERLLEEWNPELYQDSEVEVVQNIKAYIEWARMMLLKFLELPDSTRVQIAQMPSTDRNQMVHIFEENARLKEQLDAQARIPLPPALPPILPRVHVSCVQEIVEIKSPQINAQSPEEQICVDHHQVMRPTSLRINFEELFLAGKALRHASSDVGVVGGRDVRRLQEISPERWTEIIENPELLTREEFVFLKFKLESEEVDLVSLLNLKNLIEQTDDLGKLDKLLNYLEKSSGDLSSKKKITLDKISAKSNRGALARDIVGGPKLKRVNLDQ